MRKKAKYRILSNRYLQLTVGSFTTFIVLYLNTWGLLPDALSISTNINIASYLSTIISSISSLTGFLIVILIIAFEYYKSNLNKIYLKYFVANKSLIFLINYYIFVFLFAALSLLTLGSESPKSVGEITVSYISILSFLFLIPSTFLLSFRLVKGLKINDIIDEYLNILSFDDVFLINLNNKIFPSYSTDESKVTVAEIVDNDSLLILQKLIVNSLKNDDSVTAQLILNKVSDKFIVYITSKEESTIKSSTNFHQYRYASFLLSLVTETKLNPKIGERLIFDKALELIEDFYFSYNEKKYKLSYIEPFRESSISKLLAISIENENHVQKILKSVKKIIENTIQNNLPDERRIMFLDPEYRKEFNITANEKHNDKDFESEYSWRKFLENYTEYFEIQASEAIENKSEKKFLEFLSLYKSCTFSLYWEIDNPNRHLKSRWIIHNFMHLVSLYKEAIEKGIIHKVSSYQLISDNDIMDLFKNNDVCARRVLVDYLHFIIWLNKQGKLNYSIFCGIFSWGDWGLMYMGGNLTMLGSFFVKEYHDVELYKNGLEDVLNTISIVFEDYKKGISSKEVSYKTMLLILNKIKENYLISRKNKSKSQKLLRRLNKSILEVETEDNK